MRKPIFESEDEAMTFLNGILCLSTDRNTTITNTLKNIKVCGYIRRSPAEEAEEMYMLSGSYADGLPIMGRFRALKEIIDKLYEAIQYQDKRIKELEKQLEEK